MTAQRRDRVALVTGAARNACDESAFAAQPPLGRLLAPSEVAEVIAFSAVDGGLTL